MKTNKRLVILIGLIVLLSLTVIGLTYFSPQFRQNLGTLPVLDSVINLTATAPGQEPASSSENKPLYLQPVEANSASEAAKEYVNKYSAYFKPESPEIVAGFYQKPTSTNSADMQLYLYGSLTNWDIDTGVLTVQTNYGLVELKSDPAGVYNHPKNSNQLITPEGTKKFVGKSVTVWVQIRDTTLFTDRVAITTYN